MALIDLETAKAWRLPNTKRKGSPTDWHWLGEEMAMRIRGIYGPGPSSFYQWSVDTFAGPKLLQFSSFEASCGNKVCYLPSRNQLVVGGAINVGRKTRIVDFESQETVATFARQGWTFLARLAKDRILVVGMDEWAILGLPDGEVIAEADCRRSVLSAASSPDKRRFALASKGQIDVFELR